MKPSLLPTVLRLAQSGQHVLLVTPNPDDALAALVDHAGVIAADGSVEFPAGGRVVLWLPEAQTEPAYPEPVVIDEFAEVTPELWDKLLERVKR